MSWNEFIYGLGDLIEWTFQILPILGNGFNLVLIIIMFILFFYWMSRMVKFQRANEH